MPGELDGLFFEVVAKGEVAQHLEKGVVAGAGADIFQIVVLAAHPQTLLAGGGPVVVPLFQAQENVFELIHPRVDEEQRRIVGGDEIAAVHNGVVQFVEIVEKELANLFGGKLFHCRSRFLGRVQIFATTKTQRHKDGTISV